MDKMELKQIINEFIPNTNVNSFNNRLKMQKIIYILKYLDIVNYNYTWYIRGPYSVGLARDYYKTYHMGETVQVDINNPERLQKVKEYLVTENLDHSKYELLSSILYQSKHYQIPLSNTEEILHKISIEKPEFSSEDVKKMLQLALKIESIRSS